MTEHSIYSIKTAATPAFMPPPSSTMPDFCPFACDLSKLEPQLAIRIELLTAARMRETARAECRRAGMMPGAKPQAKPDNVGLNIVAPPDDVIAAVKRCVIPLPRSVRDISKVSRMPAPYVRAVLMQMLADGEVTVRKGDNHRAATYHRGAGKTSRPPVTINGVEYPTLKAAAEALDRSPAALAYHINRGTPHKIGSGCKGGRSPVTINGVEYPSQAAAARALGISESRVSQIKGRFK